MKIFYQLVKSPTTITLAYYVHDEKTYVNFYVFEPDKTVILKQKKKNRGYYTFNTKKNGEYTFQMETIKVSSKMKVTIKIFLIFFNTRVFQILK